MHVVSNDAASDQINSVVTSGGQKNEDLAGDREQSQILHELGDFLSTGADSLARSQFRDISVFQEAKDTSTNVSRVEEVIRITIGYRDREESRILPVVTLWQLHGEQTLAGEAEGVESQELSKDSP